MRIDRTLRQRLPRLNFSPFDLGPLAEPDPPEPDGTVETAYAQMLPAGHSGLDVRKPRFLVLVHIDDTERLLLGLLGLLSEPSALWSRWRIPSLSVEACASASLAGVGTIAVVVRPVTDGPDAEYVHQHQLDLAADMAELVRSGLGGADDVDGVSTPVVGVRPIARSDEFRLYAGKHFREMRFGIDLNDPTWARRCARLIARFAGVLSRRGVPLAYLHFPLNWDSLPSSWKWAVAGHVRWLRMAYAVDTRHGDTSVDSAIELDAWDIAEDENVCLAAYEPTIRGPLEDRLVPLVPPPSRRFPSIGPGAPRTPPDGGGPSAVALGVDVLAEAGLLASVMSDLPMAEVYGCTVAVLYGQTLCSIVADEPTSRVLDARLRSSETFRSVAPHPVRPRSRVVRESDDRDFAFWVAWCCSDQPGVMREVLDAVRAVSDKADVDMPNANYAISRVLADGQTCAGKVELICTRDEAVRLELLREGQPLGKRADEEDSPGWDRLREGIDAALRPFIVGWEPKTAEWVERPLAVSDAEPNEQPWGWLVVPEGAVEEPPPLAEAHQYLGELYIPPTRPPRRPPPETLFASLIDRLLPRPRSV